jgi:hypothetical protein
MADRGDLLRFSCERNFAAARRASLDHNSTRAEFVGSFLVALGQQPCAA